MAFLLAGAACGHGQPSFVFADGSVATVESWRGRWLLINYWAEWCAPCRQEIPELNALHQERPWFVAGVGVNYDGLQGQKLNELVTRMSIEFPVLVEDPRLRWAYEIPEALPMTMVIAPDGAVHGRLVGPQTVQTLMAAMR